MEKRTDRRVLKRLRVEFGNSREDQPYFGFTHDVSRMGAFVASSFLPTLASPIWVTVEDRSERFVLRGTVVRHAVVPPQLRSIQPHGFGLRLLEGELTATTSQSSATLDLTRRFPNPEALKLAFEQEIKHGGITVLSAKEFQLHEPVVVNVVFDWMQKKIQVNASVVHCLPQGAAFQVMAIFSDPQSIDAFRLTQ